MQTLKELLSNSRQLLLASIFTIILASISLQAQAQVEARSSGFNYFDRKWIFDDNYGAGFSFYAGVWSIMKEYPGNSDFQMGLTSTWLETLKTGDEPSNFYTTIEGGLGWWHDTRFGTETPKFIMGGVALNFSQWANGPGAGKTDLLNNGHRDWSNPGGKYGAAQLSQHVLWPPDGLNMEQGAEGEYLGYGYHPLPLTDVLEVTNGSPYSTGNQCWTLFLNTSNFKGPVAFFVPSYWTEPLFNNPELEGLLLDTRPSDKNLAFAIEHLTSPALIGADESGQKFAKILPFHFPKTSENRSEIIREIKVYSRDAKWNEVEDWFAGMNGGTIPSTEFLSEGTQDIVFGVHPPMFSSIASTQGTPVDADCDNSSFVEIVMSADSTVAGFEWNTDIIKEVDDQFVIPEYYHLNQSINWEPIEEADVPASTGLLIYSPAITPRNDETPYLTPLEPDCHWQNPLSAWHNPGPSAGPFTVSLGDGSVLTYYWYYFIDQPSIIHANLPEEDRQNLQSRVELIHTHWGKDDDYLPAPTSGEIIGLDPGLLVTPPEGMEVGYVPIVTRQEKAEPSSTSVNVDEAIIDLFPNPTKSLINIQSREKSISSVNLYSVHGTLIKSQDGLNQKNLTIQLGNQSTGIYMMQIIDSEGHKSVHRIMKID